MVNRKQNPRKTRKTKDWGRCPSTGLVRYGERCDAEQQVEHAFHVRAADRLAGLVPTYTIRRSFKCVACRGYHTTSVSYVDWQSGSSGLPDRAA